MARRLRLRGAVTEEETPREQVRSGCRGCVHATNQAYWNGEFQDYEALQKLYMRNMKQLAAKSLTVRQLTTQIDTIGASINDQREARDARVTILQDRLQRTQRDLNLQRRFVAVMIVWVLITFALRLFGI